MTHEGYKKINLPTPNELYNKFVGRSAIIIGTGMSTKKLVPYKNRLGEFDLVVGLNFATKDFEHQLTHHLVLEKNPIAVWKDMEARPDYYRKDLPRILNWKSLHHFSRQYNLYKATRSNFEGRPNILRYKMGNEEGFMNGPVSHGFSLGSVGLHGLHLACFMGCRNIYMIGIDLIFGQEYDHYYQDKYYRDSKTEKHKSKVIEIQHQGQIRETSEFFYESSKYINKVIREQCEPAKINVYNFSDDSLVDAEYVNIDTFFGEMK